jgi:hypothetical protein
MTLLATMLLIQLRGRCIPLRLVAGKTVKARAAAEIALAVFLENELVAMRDSIA